MYLYCYAYVLLFLYIFIVMCVLYSVSLCCSMYCLCVDVYCTVLLPPGLNPIVVNKYINQFTLIFITNLVVLEHYPNLLKA